MPANLTQDYLNAEKRFKAARSSSERIEALEEMLRVIPKHKGTDHLCGDLRKKLSQLREEQRTAPKKSAKRADPGHVPPQGAGQVVLIGPPNAGKSALMKALTEAEPEVAPYPYTTRKPQPAMMRFEDAQVQLVDAPAMDENLYEPWMNTLVRNADLGLVVLDPHQPGVLTAIEELQELLTRARLAFDPAWWGIEKGEAGTAAEEEDPAADTELDDDALLARLEPGEVELPILVAVNKMDHDNGQEEFAVLAELVGENWPLVDVSAESGLGLDRLRRAVFLGLRVIRVYSKPPGKPPSMNEPIILPLGATVRDMALLIHRELADKLRFARIWSERHYDGQRIAVDQALEDRDVIELNA